MADRIEDVLAELDSWYNELPGGTERPKLLSKLATLELCGWLEERFDSIARGLATATHVVDASSVKETIGTTYGFQYSDHVRGMFLAIGGEVLLQKVETAFDTKFPGELEQLRGELGFLWKLRCELAHGSSVAVTGRQITINAPSWCSNRQRILAKLITKLETEFHAAV